MFGYCSYDDCNNRAWHDEYLCFRISTRYAFGLSVCAAYTVQFLSLINIAGLPASL